MENKRKVNILFLCTGNSCRSQMAEGWTRHLKGDLIEAWSAGIEPKPVDLRAVRVMAEAGVDISGQRSKHVDTLTDLEFDYVITVCGYAVECCAIYLGKTKRIHRGFDDPPYLAREAKTEEESLDHYRRVRDEIRAFVEQFPDVLEKLEKNRENCSDERNELAVVHQPVSHPLDFSCNRVGYRNRIFRSGSDHTHHRIPGRHYLHSDCGRAHPHDVSAATLEVHFQHSVVC